MLFTIAICTYRRFDFLKECLLALNEQSLSSDKFKVLVVDNSLQPSISQNFKDEILGDLAFPIEYIITEKSGLSYARNVALKRTSTKYIAYLDDDAIPEPQWLEEILNAFEDSRFCAGVVGGKVEPVWGAEPEEWLRGSLKHQLAILDWGEQRIQILSDKWLVGANVAYLTQALKKIGGFSEDLGRKGMILLCHEELQVNEAIRALGYSIVYDPKAVVHHNIQAERMTVKWFCENAYWEALSRVVYDSGVRIDDHLESLSRESAKMMKSLRTDSKISITYEDILTKTKNFAQSARDVARQIGIVPTKAVRKVSPTLFIVTPCLNAEQTIDETLESVFGQAGDFSIRYHVQDGGSTDGTLDRLREWQRRAEAGTVGLYCNHVAFSFSSEGDQGLYDAIGKAFDSLPIPDNAIMSWINADDILMPGACATAIKCLAPEGGRKWLLGPIRFMNEDGSHSESFIHYPQEMLIAGCCDGKHWQCVQQEGCFWSKSLWDNAGGINRSMVYAGDWDLWRRFAMQTSPVHVQTSLGVFRRREGQLSASPLGYEKEINSVVSVAKREKSFRVLMENKEALTVEHYIVTADTQETIQIFMTNQSDGNSQPVKSNEGSTGATLMSKPSVNGGIACLLKHDSDHFLDNPTLHDIYLRSPRFVQKTLTQIKYKALLPALKMKKDLGDWLIIRRSALFWRQWYLVQNPDVAAKKVDPLVHFILHGAGEGRQPNPLFDTQWYLSNYPDVLKSSLNPLTHYIRHGWREGRDPHPQFATIWYLRNYKDVADNGIEPLRHYLTYGIFEKRKTMP